MLDPKIFYRKLDSLLNKIGQEKFGKDFLFTIVSELERSFGPDLHIGRGRVYEENGNDYVLISPIQKQSSHITKSIPADSPAFQALLATKTYIFDNPALTIDKAINNQKEYKIPAAVMLRSSEFSWIFVFELKSGWIREEIEFCLNAVRTMLNFRFISEAAENEMKQAAHIQQSLLPSSAPKFPGLSVAGFSQAAELVGGDLYDYFNFDNEVFGLCVGDASGHGIPAALLVRDVVTGLRMGLEKQMKMVYTFKKLNKVIYQSVYSTRFISLFYAEIEKDGNVIFVNAGHPSPLIYNGNDFRELQSTGLIFGAVPEIELTRGYARMNLNDVMVLYSDGIIERKSPTLEDYGVDKLKETIIANASKSAEEILNAIFESAKSFGDRNDWEDDATIVVVKKTDENTNP